MPQITTAQAQGAAQAAYGKLPTSFVVNAGQVDPAVRFTANSSAGSLFFTPGGVTLSIPLTYASPAADQHPGAPEDKQHAQAPSIKTAVAIKLNFIGANPNAVIEGTNVLPGTANYFIGNDKSKWATNVKTYGGVGYRNLYPGIDLSYNGYSGTLKGTYTVAPGADPSQIGWQYKGADSAAVDGQGNLAIKASTANLTEQVPEVWQVRADGSHTPVTASYQVDSQGVARFALGAYDHAQPLIVDPGLVYSTYLGGSGYDTANGIAVNSAGEAYITGYSTSTNFPISTGVYQISNGGGADAFVTKLNTGGTAILYSTYIGGSLADAGQAIALNPAGNFAYITGYTYSTNFPVTSGSFQTSLHGSTYNAFVTVLNPAGNGLWYSTYLGGSGGDDGYGITSDSAGVAYVTGYTTSTDFPTTSGAFQTAFQPFSDAVSSDAFVTKLNYYGTGLTYSTYLGASGYTGAYGIAVDGSGNAYVTGYITGTYWNDYHSYQPVYGGSAYDGFMTELNSTGSDYHYSTMLGGTGSDWGNAIALDQDGYVYITGPTTGGFPVTSGAFQTGVSNTNYHGFVTELDPPATDNHLYYSTYLGGNGIDVPRGIAVDRYGDAHVTGYTNSTDFPTTGGAFQSSLLGAYNAFATMLYSNGAGLVHSTYLGGAGTDDGAGVATDYSRNTYVAGYTTSTNFPLMVPIQGSYQGGSDDAFVTKLDTLGAHRLDRHLPGRRVLPAPP